MEQNASITIYPEAHIWPYCTFIRKFGPETFLYPSEKNVPSFVITACYTKRKIGTRPKIIFVCDGPFYPDMTLPKKERMQKLRDEVFNAMDSAAKKYSDYEYYRYVKATDEQQIDKRGHLITQEENKS